MVVAARAAFDELAIDASLATLVLDVEFAGSRRFLRFRDAETAISIIVVIAPTGPVLCLAVEPPGSTIVEVHRPSVRAAVATTDSQGRCVVRLDAAGLVRLELHHTDVPKRTCWLRL